MSSVAYSLSHDDTDLPEYWNDSMQTPFEIKDISAQTTLGVTHNTTKTAFMSLFDVWFPKLWEVVTKTGAQPLSGPFARYHRWDDEAVVIELAAPIAAAVEVVGDFKIGQTPAGRAIVFQHIGHYNGLMEAWASMQKWMKENGYEPNGGGWETYVTDPRTEPDSTKWVTEITQPIR